MELKSKYIDYTIEDFVEDKDFRNWLSSPNEILNSFWTNFQEKNPEKRETIELARQIVQALVVEEETISREEYQVSIDELKTYISQKSTLKTSTRRFPINWRNVAAILLIPVLAFSIYQYQTNNTRKNTGQVVQYVVPVGQKSKVILADGTKVWLNSGSTLSVSMDNTNRRKVQLSGEAYFDVTKDKKTPFVVDTKDYAVKVYGTQFNVRSYDDQTGSETILKEGSVSIVTHSNQEIKMAPGQRFLLDQEKKYALSEVNPELYLSWTNNVLKIDNEKLQDFVVRMERWYGVSIHVDEFERVKDLRYTLTIKTESLREMLDLMNYVTPFKYTINGENVNIKYN